MEQGFKGEIVGILANKEGFIGVDLEVQFKRTFLEFNAEEFGIHFNSTNFLIVFTGEVYVVLTKYQIREIWGGYLDLLWSKDKVPNWA